MGTVYAGGTMVTPEERWDAKYADGPGSTEAAAMLDEIADVFPWPGAVGATLAGSPAAAIGSR